MNKVVKILFFIILSFNLNVFAEHNIDLQLSNSDVIKNDIFDIYVNIETTYTGTIEIISINGIENFNKVGQENSSEFSNINGEIFNKLKLKISLISPNIGKFTIGPVELKIGDEIIRSNTVLVNVNEQLNDITIGSEENKNDSNNVEDIKGIKKSYSFFDNFVFFQVLIILLLTLLYIYNVRLVKKKHEKKAIKKSEKMINKKNKITIKNKLKKILDNANVFDKTQFYEKLNKYFREYFDFLGYGGTEIMTLKEIGLLDLDKKLFKLFEKSYLNEFNDKKDTLAIRKKIINDLLKIIK